MPDHRQSTHDADRSLRSLPAARASGATRG